MNQALIQAIQSRRSYRAYQPKPVPEETLKAIAELAVQAPSANNRQPWQVVMVSNQEWLAAFDQEAVSAFKAQNPDFDASRKIFYGAPAALFVFADTTISWGETDCGMLAQTTQLAAEAYGLGSCIIGMANATFNGPNAQKYLDDLGVKEGWKPMYAIIIGYPEGSRPDAKPRDLEKIHYMK